MVADDDRRTASGQGAARDSAGIGASRRFVSLSAEATQQLAAALGRGAHAGLVIALDGDLGAGKTTFVRGLAQGLGADEAEVASPTYTLMHEVPGRLTLYHFDAWMSGREEAFLADGGAELMLAGGVAAIEWAERVVDYLPGDRLDVRLGHRSPEERTIELCARGADERIRRLLSGLEASEGLRELGQGMEPSP